LYIIPHPGEMSRKKIKNVPERANFFYSLSPGIVRPQIRPLPSPYAAAASCRLWTCFQINPPAKVTTSSAALTSDGYAAINETYSAR